MLSSRYLSQCWAKSTSPYGVTRPRCMNSLWPSDAIWRHRSWSTLAQVMACCLTAPSHYLNQCWLIINTDQWHLSKGSFTRDTPANFFSNLPGANESTYHDRNIPRLMLDRSKVLNLSTTTHLAQAYCYIILASLICGLVPPYSTRERGRD